MRSQVSLKLFSVQKAAKVLGLSPGLVCAQKRIRHERHGLGRGKIKIPGTPLKSTASRWRHGLPLSEDSMLDFMTVPEAAKTLRRSVSFVYARIADGSLPHYFYCVVSLPS